MNFSNRIVLILILIAAIALRFYDYGRIPFTHDEFSALSRLRFSDVNALIDKGVRVDGHPAGVQVFLYYWTQVFGCVEWVVKLPFTIFGVLSVWLVYQIGRYRYNETVALISAAFVASLQYTIVHSQTARPYAAGLFFSLLMALSWLKLMREPEKKFYRKAVVFVVAAVCCAYIHHFSLLFAFIVGISGLFYIDRAHLRKYLLCGGLIALLYIPHLGILIDQLALGGVGSWLATPHWDFILDYTGYVFHFSLLTIALVLILMVFGFYRASWKEIRQRPFVLPLIWFLLPIIMGFFYSLFVNPVLQYSVVIFGFPFLLFVIFGHFKAQRPAVNALLVCAILIVNIFTLVEERRHYALFYHSPYESLLLDYAEANEAYPSLLSLIGSHREISNYYLDKHHIKPDFIFLDSIKNEMDLTTFMKTVHGEYSHLYVGITASVKASYLAIIRDYYPQLIRQKNHAGATGYLFAKGDPDESLRFVRHLDYGGESGGVYTIDSTLEWYAPLVFPLNKIIDHQNDFVDISLKVVSGVKPGEVELVAILESHGKIIHWGSTHFHRFSTGNREGFAVHHSVKLSDIRLKYPDIQLKIVIWNKNRQKLVIDDLRVAVRRGNPLIYGLVENIVP